MLTFIGPFITGQSQIHCQTILIALHFRNKLLRNVHHFEMITITIIILIVSSAFVLSGVILYIMHVC